MKLFGIDTSTSIFYACLYDNGRIYEYELEAGKRLSRIIAPTIKRLQEASGMALKDLDCFVCGLGPGSFTGMRVGLSMVKGLAWVLGKPVIGISTLDILAMNAPDTKADIFAIADAKRNLVYACAYRKKSGRLKRITPYSLLNESQLIKKIKPGSVVLGDGLNLYKNSLLRQLKGLTILDKDYWRLLPCNIILKGLEGIKEKKITDAFRIEPLYIYPKECQIRR